MTAAAPALNDRAGGRVTGLRIAEDLSLPNEAVVQTFAILAKRGVGKTYLVPVMVEEMLKAGLQVVVADPVGVTWGLRSSADGKQPGLPIVVLGGDHGDLPLDVAGGQLIADLVIDERLSVVLDLSRFRKGEQVRFMTDFAEQLYHRNRNPLHLVLDEADSFAPQRPQKGQERMLGAVEDLVRRGRARGLGVSLVTQRSAVLNKDVLTQVEVLVALRTIAPQDRAAIDEWIKVHGTPEQREQLMSSLPSLPIGTAWFWSPGWLDLFQRIKVRKRETFDSSATPEVGKKIVAPKHLADVDLEALRARLASTIEKARADDPRELRKRIAELERQVRAGASRAQVESKIEIKEVRVEVPVLSQERFDELANIANATARQAGEMATIADRLLEASGHILHALTSGNSEQPIPREIAKQPVARIDPIPRSPQRPPPMAPVPQSQRAADFSIELTGPQKRVMDAVATLRNLGLDRPQKAAVAAMARYSPTSGGYANLLGQLKALGMIDYPSPGLVALTEEGALRGTPHLGIKRLEDFHQAWLDIMSGPQRKLMQVLIACYPDAMLREELARETGYSPTSGGYANLLGQLRTLGAVDYPERGHVVATELLFPSLPSRAR